MTLDMNLIWGNPSPKPSEKTYESSLQSLNAEQLEAVTTTEGAVLINAGAGTGKTKALTTRIAYLIESKQAKPNEILAVTFTNKAALEMKERLIDLIGDSGKKVNVGSFHAIALSILKKNPRRCGLKNDRFIILDETDQNHLFQDIARDLEIMPEGEFFTLTKRVVEYRWQAYIMDLVSSIKEWKEEGLTPKDIEEFIKTDPTFKTPITEKKYLLYKTYQEILQKRNSVDFADLLMLLNTLFENDPVLRDDWSRQFKYIMVDEFQDTNMLQYKWIKHLSHIHQNICVVGDLDQCIYEWRNARPEIFTNFEKDWKNCKTITLYQNYRSTQNILDTANKIVEDIPRPYPKELKGLTKGTPVRLEEYDTHFEEAKGICDIIQRYLNSGESPNEIALLFRSNHLMIPFEAELEKLKIPYSVLGGQKFYEREEIKDALSYLKLSVNLYDDLSFLRIINKPNRMIPEAVCIKVSERCQSLSETIPVACRTLAKDKKINQSTKINLENFADLLEDLHYFAENGEKPNKVLITCLERISYISWKIQNNDDHIEEQEASLQSFLETLENYDDVTHFLHSIGIEKMDLLESSETIKLSTIHAAKGLEWNVVITPCLEDGVLPNQKAGLTPYGQNEEKRIAHVAWTRPKKTLIISFSKSRNYKKTIISPYLKTLGLKDGDPLLDKEELIIPLSMKKNKEKTFKRKSY